MKSKKIYIVRHGQTDFNLKGIVQGRGVNSSINKTGRLQADAFYAAYKNIRFDKVYTSALKRTQESVRKFIEKGIPHQALHGLDEINWGVQEGKEVTEERDKYYNGVIDRWRTGETDLVIEGGESPEMVSERLGPVLDIILSDEDDQNILICHHGRALRVLLCKVLNYPLKYMDIFEHTNLGLYMLNYSGELFTIEKHNYTKHLEVLEEL